VKPVKRRELIRRLNAGGCSGPHSGNKHQHVRKGNLRVSIPNPHGSKDVPVTVIRTILQTLGITEDQWNKL